MKSLTWESAHIKSIPFFNIPTPLFFFSDFNFEVCHQHWITTVLVIGYRGTGRAVFMLLCDVSSICFTWSRQSNLDYTISRKTGHHVYAPRIASQMPWVEGFQATFHPLITSRNINIWTPFLCITVSFPLQHARFYSSWLRTSFSMQTAASLQSSFRFHVWVGPYIRTRRITPSSVQVKSII